MQEDVARFDDEGGAMQPVTPYVIPEPTTWQKVYPWLISLASLGVLIFILTR